MSWPACNRVSSYVMYLVRFFGCSESLGLLKYVREHVHVAAVVLLMLASCFAV
jgi:hypothetical protein